MQTCASTFTQARIGAVRPQRATSVRVMAFDAKKIAANVAIGAASLALTLGAQAAGVKLGADNGSLVFDPATITVAKGDSVTWTNNAGFPHNIVFDEDSVPAGVNAEAISHEDYLNAPGETYTVKFTEAGEYGYYCEPHQGAGMQGKVIVQ